ncbi:acyltransferase family protein [Candidatus Enterococcus murrayae]|uniref:Acyltransferase family protein n=1 Tax=Candidatus Enterococcus murrayae TaxID=2815321 RepID=A0ABS3HJP2_9ENTE|nr:acyltransferase family protein [Enterococcus sp. MJM16]MBO0453665.1 acyltransferase family protein [Enterococcus sp. MJM16]
MEKRDAYFDNAKLFLMILVVFGHFLQPFMDDHPLYNDLYYFIFTFHMPAFILISGYFAKNGPKPIMSLVKKLLLPYLFFQVLYSCYYTLIGLQDSFSLDLGIPQWSLWFLLSLFGWNVLLHLINYFSVKQVLIGSVILALLVGYFPIFDRYLAIQRTLAFFPYFMVGYVIPKSWVEKLKAYPKKWMALLLFSGLFLFIQGNDLINKYWVFGSKPYEDYLAHPLLGGPQRLLFFVAGLIGIIAFLLLVPKERHFFSNWGKNTLTVYLLHGFLVKGLRALEYDFEISSLELVLLFIGSMLLTAALSSRRVGQWIKKGKRVLQPSL